MNEAISHIEANDIELTEYTKQYFDRKPFPISEAIHVAVIGDSNVDVYTKETYEVIGRFVISPIVGYFKFPERVGQRIFPLNLGKRFDIEYISRFAKV